MEANRILPDLQSALICEDVRQERGGNFILIGILSSLRVPKVPISALKLFFFSRWTAGFGVFKESIHLVAPDQTTVVRKSQIKFTLRDPSQNWTTVTMFTQVTFKLEGVYYVEIMVDDVMKLRFPLPVTISKPKDSDPAEPPDGPESENEQPGSKE